MGIAWGSNWDGVSTALLVLNGVDVMSMLGVVSSNSWCWAIFSLRVLQMEMGALSSRSTMDEMVGLYLDVIDVK
jgi:hypothetical protein